MFEWVYRAPRGPEDFEAAFILQEPPKKGSMKKAFQGINKANKIESADDLEKLIWELAKGGQVTRIHVVNRVKGGSLAKNIVATVCDFIQAKGIHAVYSERLGAV